MDDEKNFETITLEAVKEINAEGRMRDDVLNFAQDSATQIQKILDESGKEISGMATFVLLQAHAELTATINAVLED